MTSTVIDLTTTYEGDSFTLTAVLGKTSADGGNGGNANGLWGQPLNPSTGISVDIDITRTGDGRWRIVNDGKGKIT